MYTQAMKLVERGSYSTNSRSANVHDRKDEESSEDSKEEDEGSDVSKEDNDSGDSDNNNKNEDTDKEEASDSDREKSGDDGDDQKKKTKKKGGDKKSKSAKRAEIGGNLIRRRAHDVGRMWGDGSIARNESRYKIVKFKFFQHNVWKEMKMCFSHTNDDAHMQVYVQSLLLKLGGNKVAATALKHTILNALNMAMTEYIKGMKLKTGFSGKIVSGEYIDYSKNNGAGNGEPNDTLIIQAVYMTDVCTTSKTPICIDVDGIDDPFMEKHYASWDTSDNHFSILSPNSNPRYLHQNVSAAAPNLASIHGIHKHKVSCAEDISQWGEIKDDDILVKMPSAYFVWLIYNLIELIKVYILKDGASSIQNTSKKHKKLSDKSAEKIDQKKLPRNVTKQQWTKLLKLHKKHGQIDIYKINANLSDDYIGKVIKILTPEKGTSQLTWTVSQDDPKFRVPLDFAHFAAPYYDQTVQTVSLSESNEIQFSANRGNLIGSSDKAEDVFVTVRIAVFRPSMLFYIREVEKTLTD